MIATLTFKIHGTSKRVKERGREFMDKMHPLVGKPVDGTTLVEVGVKYSRSSLMALNRKQIDRLFKPFKP